MNGGLFQKSISRVALLAAAGLFVGGVAMPSAKAADLGGDCCADLEERVAELEATTARKGNRRMSVTVTGQVNRMILGWDDGKSSDVYWGVDNTNSSTRFSFLGEAKVTGAIKMGFDITIEIEAGGTSSKLSQFDDDGKVGTQINGAAAASFQGSNVDSYFGDARRVAWWIEHKDAGRLTVGKFDLAGVQTTIDLAGIAVAASGSMSTMQGGFLIRGDSATTFYAITMGTMFDPAANQGRAEQVRYDTPTIAGFIGSASIAEAGDVWGAMLRYAGEFSGIRIAAGIGYENITDRQTSASQIACASVLDGPGAADAVCVPSAGAGPADLLAAKPKVEAWGGSLAVLHVPSGLFVQGHYMAADFSTAGVSQQWGQTIADKKDANQWLVQAGIAKNWFGLGNTALYAEYSKSNDWGATNPGRAFSNAAIPGSDTVNGVIETTGTHFGLGLTQNVDAAATTLYLAWRHFEFDITCTGAGANCGGAAGGAAKKLPTEDQDFVYGGAVVKF